MHQPHQIPILVFTVLLSRLLSTAHAISYIDDADPIVTYQGTNYTSYNANVNSADLTDLKASYNQTYTGIFPGTSVVIPFTRTGIAIFGLEAPWQSNFGRNISFTLSTPPSTPISTNSITSPILLPPSKSPIQLYNTSILALNALPSAQYTLTLTVNPFQGNSATICGFYWDYAEVVGANEGIVLATSKYVVNMAGGTTLMAGGYTSVTASPQPTNSAKEKSTHAGPIIGSILGTLSSLLLIVALLLYLQRRHRHQQRRLHQLTIPDPLPRKRFLHTRDYACGTPWRSRTGDGIDTLDGRILVYRKGGQIMMITTPEASEARATADPRSRASVAAGSGGALGRVVRPPANAGRHATRKPRQGTQPSSSSSRLLGSPSSASSPPSSSSGRASSRTRSNGSTGVRAGVSQLETTTLTTPIPIPTPMSMQTRETQRALISIWIPAPMLAPRARRQPQPQANQNPNPNLNPNPGRANRPLTSAQRTHLHALVARGAPPGEIAMAVDEMRRGRSGSGRGTGGAGGGTGTGRRAEGEGGVDDGAERTGTEGVGDAPPLYEEAACSGGGLR